MSRLLIDDYPMQILPKLAVEIGLNEAIILQQLHYWLKSSKHKKDGDKWIYNTYKDWRLQFPFWSDRTIRRTISSLEKQNLIRTANYNRAGFDKTKWYSLNYEALNLVAKRCGQNDQTIWPKCPNGVGQNDQVELAKMATPIPETNTEITTETTTENNMSSSSTAYPYKKIIDYLNERTGKHFRHTTQKTKVLIKARMKEGFTEEEFKQVIDNKVKEWKGYSKFEVYLRPETLFGTKFEGYLNQKVKGSSIEQLERMKYDPSYWEE